ncbi:MAG TPA: vWA domain-containing protein [Planctomycetota bacterium]|nr:vWA domain-containing protein [Planctomycetota bacterium]
MARSLLLALLLLPAATARAEDPAIERYRQFYKDEIAGKYQAQQDSDQRVVMLRGFQRHDVFEASKFLIDEVLSKEKAADTIREAVRILGNYKDPDNTDAIAKLYPTVRKWETRVLLLTAFGAMKNDTAEKLIALGLKDSSPRVAAAACRAAGTGRRRALLPDLLAFVQKHKSPAVRAAALVALKDLGDEDALPVIFQAFCGDPSSRVRYDAWLALRKMAMEQLPCDPAAWQDFWKRQSGEVPEGEANPWGKAFPKVDPKAGGPGNFFRIPVLGDRVCFVIDTTGDMMTPWKIDRVAEGDKPADERIPDFENVTTRFGLVRAYVMQCLEQAAEQMEVAFVFFNKEATPWPSNQKFLRNTGKNREQIRSKLQTGMELKGLTAMYEGLAAGWGFAKGGLDGNFDKGADTIVFVTDGRPTDGELANRPERLRDEAWLIATLQNVRFETVGLHNHQFDLLQAMARDSDGLYVHAQQFGDEAEPQDLEFWPEKKKAFEAARKAAKKAAPSGDGSG